MKASVSPPARLGAASPPRAGPSVAPTALHPADPSPHRPLPLTTPDPAVESMPPASDFLDSLRRAIGARRAPTQPSLPLPADPLALVYRVWPPAPPAAPRRSPHCSPPAPGPRRPLHRTARGDPALRRDPGPRPRLRPARGGTLSAAYRRLKKHAGEIRTTSTRGRYLGFCLAATWPAPPRLRRSSRRHRPVHRHAGATVHHDRDTLVETAWRASPAPSTSRTARTSSSTATPTSPSSHLSERHRRRPGHPLRRRSRRRRGPSPGSHRRLVPRRGPLGPPHPRPGAGPGGSAEVTRGPHDCLSTERQWARPQLRKPV